MVGSGLVSLLWLIFVGLSLGQGAGQHRSSICADLVQHVVISDESIRDFTGTVTNATEDPVECLTSIRFENCSFSGDRFSLTELLVISPQLQNVTVIGSALEILVLANYSHGFDLLDFSNNALTHVIGFSYVPLVVKRLDLSKNALEQLELLMAGSSKINDLDLSWNRLKYFESSISVSRLDLSNNKLTQVTLLDDTSNGLIWLNMSRNNLKIAPSLRAGFGSFPNLEHLDVSFNRFEPFTDVYADAFRRLTNLYMRHTGLTFIDSQSFQKLSSLKLLDVSDNPGLSGIYGHFNDDLKNLETLNLENCGIRSLPSDVFARLPSSLKYLNLNGNHVHCSGCNLTWYNNAVSRAKFPIIGNLICGDIANFSVGEVLSNATFCEFPLGKYNESCDCDSVQFVNLHQPRLNIRYGRYGEDMWVPCTLFVPLGTHVKVTWIRGYEEDPVALFEWDTQRQEVTALNNTNERLILQPGGTLVVREMTRGEIDVYKCKVDAVQGVAPLPNDTILFSVRIDYSEWWHIEVFSIIVAIATGILLTMAHGILSLVRHGVVWRIKDMEQISRARHLIVSLEKYKQRQMEAIQEKYNQKVTRIAENYHSQVDSLRSAYSTQSDRFREARTAQLESVTATLDTAREGYAAQMARLREYGARQADRVWESYQHQIERVRVFTQVQRDRLSRQYHINQRYLDKILKSIKIREPTYVEPEPVGPRLFSREDDFFAPLGSVGSPGHVGSLSTVKTPLITDANTPERCMLPEFRRSGLLDPDFSQRPSTSAVRSGAGSDFCPELLVNSGYPPMNSGRQPSIIPNFALPEPDFLEDDDEDFHSVSEMDFLAFSANYVEPGLKPDFIDRSPLNIGKKKQTTAESQAAVRRSMYFDPEVVLRPPSKLQLDATEMREIGKERGAGKKYENV